MIIRSSHRPVNAHARHACARGMLAAMWACALFIVPPASAQTPKPDAKDADRPPIVQFPEGGISLAEAVRLTLQHDPAIKLQQATHRFQQGVAQEQQGAFDTTLTGRLFYEYRLQELPESRKEIERDRRTNLQEVIDLNREDHQRAQALLTQLNAVRNAPPGAGQAQAVSAIDPDIGAQLQALDLLINSQPDANVRNQLFTLRQDFITRTIADTEAGARGFIEGFQTAEQRLADIGATPNDEVFYNGGFDVQVGRRLRNGITISPFVSGQVEGSNYRDKPRSSDFGGKGLEDLYTFKAGVSAVVPLARGRGADAAGAFEKAARIEADASELAVRHQASVSVLNTVRAYWGLRAAQAAADAAQRSVTLQGRLVELSRASIDAGEMAQIELSRAQAAQASATARLRDTERGLHEARVALAMAIGVAAGEDDRTLPRASDGFPTPPEGDLAAGVVSVMASDAGTLRQDLKSAQLAQEAGRVLARSARTDMRPRFDVVNDTWISAIDERSAGNALDRWVGPSTNLRLELERPFGNNTFRGRYAQREAEARQRQVDAWDLQRQVKLGVIRSAQSVQQARGRVEEARAAVEAYQQTTDAEIERFRAGESTLIDTILTDTQYVDAQNTLAAAEAELASLIAELRFESGLLVSFKERQPIVNERDLITVPRTTPRSTP